MNEICAKSFFQKNDYIAFKYVSLRKKRKQTVFVLAMQTSILLCAVHHITKTYPQTNGSKYFAVHLLLFSKVKINCLEILGFKMPAVLKKSKKSRNICCFFFFFNPVIVLAHYFICLITYLCLNVSNTKEQ